MSTIYKNTILEEIEKIDRCKPCIFLVAKYKKMNWRFEYGYSNSFESYIDTELKNQKEYYFDEENKIPIILPLLLFFSNDIKKNEFIVETELIPKLVLYSLFMKDSFLIKPISESYDLFLETFEKHNQKIFQSRINTFNHINVFTSKDIVLALWIEKPAITIEEWEAGEEDLCGSLRVLCMSPSSDEKYFKPDPEYFKPEVEYLKPKVEYLKPKVEYLKPEVEYLKPKVEYLKPEVEYLKPEVFPTPVINNNLGKKYKIDSERENYFNKKIRCAF
jgi:hypothetical protein